MPATAPDTSSPAQRGTPTFCRLLPLLLIAVGAAACQDNETAVARGDRLWADSSFTGALAEYRLAVAQRDDDQALSRLAHAYARLGNLEDARLAYAELVRQSPRSRDQAVFDLLDLAERAVRRGDAYTAAAAMDAALELRPEIQPAGNALANVARFYRDRGRVDQALQYYRRALSALPPDSTPPVLYEIGRLEEERGDCATATDFFRAARQQAGDAAEWRVLATESQWQTGSCAFRLAREAMESDRHTEALAHLERVLRLGVPENLLDQAWFERGELLLARGELDEALASYRRVLDRNPARTGQLVERAQRRIDQIRFGRVPADTAGGA